LRERDRRTSQHQKTMDEQKDATMAEATEATNPKKRKLEEDGDTNNNGDDDVPEAAPKRNKCEDAEKDKDKEEEAPQPTAASDNGTLLTTDAEKTTLVKEISKSEEVTVTFDDSKWDWIEKLPEAKDGLTTFIGPYLEKENTAVDLVGEIEAKAVWEVLTSLHKKGYVCPAMAVPPEFDPLADVEYFNDADAARLKTLPLGISYLMLGDDPSKEINIHDSDGVVCGQISNFGVPPSYTWARIRCTSQSNLAKEVEDILSNDVTGKSNFAFASFGHLKSDITDRDYLTKDNIFAEERDLRLFVETGDIQNALASMFTVEKGKDTVAKCLVTYRNLNMMTGGPNIVQIEVAKEYENRGLFDWLLSCVEDFYVSKFRNVLGEHPDLLKMTAGNIDARTRDKAGELIPDFFSERGYSGSGKDRSKSLLFKMIKRGLQTSLNEVSNRNMAVPLTAQNHFSYPQKPKDPRLNFISARAEALVDAVIENIPDKVLPGIAKLLTRAAMEPSIPDINKPPALFSSPRDDHTAAVSESMAVAIVDALPKDRSVSSSDSHKSQSGDPNNIGTTEMVEEVSDAIIKGMVDSIPDKQALAQAVVDSAPELDLPAGTVAAALSMVNAGSDVEMKDGNAEDPSNPASKSDRNKKRSKTASEILVSNVTDSIGGITPCQDSNLAPEYEDKKIDDVKVSSLTSAGMGLSGAIAKAVTDAIPDRVIPEVAVALTQAVAQDTAVRDSINSKFSVPTTMKRGPGALANSVLNVVPDKTVPEVAVALTEAAMDAIPTQALDGRTLKWVAPAGQDPSIPLAATVLEAIPKELVSQVAVALTQAVIDKIPDKDLSVTSGDSGSKSEAKTDKEQEEK